MSKKVMHFKDLKNPPAPYNNIVVANEKLIFIATQPSIDWTTGNFIDGNIYEQTNKALENIKMFVEKAGSSLENIVKIGIFLANLKDFDAMNEVYKDFFPDPKTQPVRFTLQTAFPNPKIKVEFEAIAIF